MGIVKKQSILSTTLLYIGAIIGYINILYLFPRFLSTSEIGTVRTIQDMAALFVPLAQFGLTQSLIRFFPKLGINENNRSGFLTLILLFGLGGYLFFMLLVSILQDPILAYFSTNAREIIEYFPIALGVTFLLLIYNLLVAYCQSLLNIVAPNFIKDVLFRIAIAGILLAYFFGLLDFNGLMLMLLAAYGLMVLSIITFLAGRKQLKLSFKFGFLSGKLSSQLLTYAVFSLLGASGMLIIGKIDSLMITGMIGTSLNGIYTTVFYIAVIIELPKRAINQISLPLISRSFEKGDMSAIGKIYKQSSINQLIIGSLLLIGIWINIDSLFSLMPNGESFAVGKWVVIIIGMGRIFDMAAGVNSEIIIMSKYYKFNMVLLGFLAVFTILLNLWLIPAFGINGAAIGSASAIVLFNLSKFLFIHKKMNIQPFSIGTLSVLIIATITLLISLNIPTLSNPLWDIVFRSGIAILLFVLGILILKPSKEVQEIVYKLFPRRRNNL